jgi:hypothetical protein
MPLASCVFVSTPSLAYRRRREIMRSQGLLRQGFTVDSLCGQERCVAPPHIILRPWKQLGTGALNAFAEQLAALKMDEWFDIPDYPNDNDWISRFRGRLGQYKPCSMVKFLVRALPSGGIRVIRVGTWFGEVSNKVTQFSVSASLK